MYRGGKICLTVHFEPLWAENCHFDAFWLAAEELIDRTDPTESESDESDKAHEAVPSSIANFLGNLLKN
ncbi:hypothetical protein RHGRI_016488 [Rhododendron griersonianum]|uniref:Ubiquitin-fold modifier-conjugating enzyme 1 n=1 Tax=Rhododendron griersonianum TaxID=479676 RepID=A0AAV6JUD3_9ERIC|nr:hypothetical protein RHGRI_016488 [Rhododendron griersonianum]